MDQARDRECSFFLVGCHFFQEECLGPEWRCYNFLFFCYSRLKLQDSFLLSFLVQCGKGYVRLCSLKINCLRLNLNVSPVRISGCKLTTHPHKKKHWNIFFICLHYLYVLPLSVLTFIFLFTHAFYIQLYKRSTENEIKLSIIFVLNEFFLDALWWQFTRLQQEDNAAEKNMHVGGL